MTPVRLVTVAPEICAPVFHPSGDSPVDWHPASRALSPPPSAHSRPRSAARSVDPQSGRARPRAPSANDSPNRCCPGRKPHAKASACRDDCARSPGKKQAGQNDRSSRKPESGRAKQGKMVEGHCGILHLHAFILNYASTATNSISTIHTIPYPCRSVSPSTPRVL